MPTSLRVGPYRFFFYSSDAPEPPHIHVRRDRKTAKFWLEPARLQYSHGFSRQEVNEIIAIIRDHETQLIEEWYEHFG
jgi:hypothetical protein